MFCTCSLDKPVEAGELLQRSSCATQRYLLVPFANVYPAFGPIQIIIKSRGGAEIGAAGMLKCPVLPASGPWLNYAQAEPVGRKLSTWKASGQEWSSGASRALVNQNQGLMVTNVELCVRGGGAAVDICKLPSAVLFLCAENKYVKLSSRLQVLILGEEKINFK